MHLNLNKHIALLWVVFITLFFSCKKEEIREDMDIPYISIKKISPTLVHEFAENILLEVAYEDGNGDLGDYDPDIMSLSVKDSRLEQADMYHIQPLAPQGEELYIKGSFQIYLNTCFLLGVGSSEKLTFTVRIKDRAGNWSNSVTSEEITILE